LGDEFNEYASIPLFHDLIWGPECEDWSIEGYVAFTENNRRVDGALWEHWALWPSRSACSRFFGFDLGARGFLKRFEQLACGGYRILKEFRDLHYEKSLAGFRCDALRFVNFSVEEYNFGWLKLVHEWAYRFPTDSLRGRCSWWRHDDLGCDIDDVPTRMTECRQSGARYHSHPVLNTLEHDVFSASSAFIRFCLAPDYFIDLGPRDGTPELNLPAEPSRPYWDSRSGNHGTLWFNDQLIKCFDKPAESQQILLDAFQEAGWPAEIENPFLGRSEIEDYNAPDCLRNTVESLNERHLSEDVIHFGTQDNRKLATWSTCGQG
jgi:hypothetical protein